MTTTIASRLADALILRGMDMKTASRAAGLGETYVRDVLKRNLNPTAAALLKLGDALSVRPEWLLTGDGPVEINSDPRFKELLSTFETLNDEQRRTVLHLMEMLAKRDPSQPE